jgi:cytochrome bd-type quinol oxidase subunit 2
MTVVLAVLLPVVLAYQGWTYHVFGGGLGAPARHASPHADPAERRLDEG